jgi:transcriptional regulator
MYAPRIFQNTNDEEIKRFIRENGFAILVSQVDSRPWASHIPLELSEDGGQLFGHVSKANPQWRNFSEGAEVLAIFTGPHAYISSSWYDHENVPTWNYIAVHVYGNVRIIEGEALLQSLKRLVDKYEVNSASPVSVEKMSSQYLDKQLNGVTGFAISINEVHASYKLSQNRDTKNYDEVIRQLEKRTDAGSAGVAEAMKTFRPKK